MDSHFTGKGGCGGVACITGLEGYGCFTTLDGREGGVSQDTGVHILITCEGDENIR